MQRRWRALLPGCGLGRGGLGAGARRRAGRATAAMPAARATRARRQITPRQRRPACARRGSTRRATSRTATGAISATSFQATPILFEDTLYLCTPFNRVVALDPRTGAARWTFDPEGRDPQGQPDAQDRRRRAALPRRGGVGGPRGAPRARLREAHLRGRDRRAPDRARCGDGQAVHGLRQRRHDRHQHAAELRRGAGQLQLAARDLREPRDRRQRDRRQRAQRHAARHRARVRRAQRRARVVVGSRSRRRSRARRARATRGRRSASTRRAAS